MLKVLAGLLILITLVVFGCTQPISVQTQFPTPGPTGPNVQVLECYWDHTWSGTDWIAKMWGKVKALTDLSYVKATAIYKDASQSVIGECYVELTSGLKKDQTWDFVTPYFHSSIEPAVCDYKVEGH